MNASQVIRPIELLAPARNAETAIEAIKCGADAVYMGSESHGARVAAGNSVDDIARVVDFAHQYNARVYVTLNTIIYDNEIDDVKALIGNGSVIIEYDVITGKLYSVWYCESTGCYAFDEGRRSDRAGRLKSDVYRVEGYYTGNVYG